MLRIVGAPALLLTLLLFISSFVEAGSSGITYQGRILDASGRPLVAESVPFVISIAAGTEAAQANCLLYSERTTVAMNDQSGAFSLVVGRGLRTDGGTLTFRDVFSPHLRYGGGDSCPGGFNKNSTNKLFLNVAFDSGTGLQSLSPIEITAIPVSMDTQNVAGIPSEMVLRVDIGSSAAPLGAGNYSLNGSDYGALVDLLNGTSPKYARVNEGGNMALTGKLLLPLNGFSVGENQLVATGESVGIGTSTPHSSAVLDVASTSKGAVFPRMTTVMRDAISSPIAGLQIYNTSTNEINFYNGNNWQALGVAGSGISSLTAGTGLTGGILTTAGTISVDVGTTGHKIVQLNGDGQLPAVSGINLTQLNAGNLVAGTVPYERLPIGTMSSTIAAGDDPRFGDARSPVGTASGDLGGNYPNPIVTHLRGKLLSSTPPTSGQVLRWDGSAYTPTNFGISHLLTITGGPQFGSANCSSSQTLTWSALTDTFACVNIASLNASVITAGTLDVGRIPSLDWSKINSGKPTTLSGYGITDAASSNNPGFTGNVTMPGMGVWTSEGKVGIGTLSPQAPLHVVGNIQIGASSGVGIDPVINNPKNIANFAVTNYYPGSGTNVNSSFTVIPRGTGVANNRAQINVFNTDYLADSANYEFAGLRARGADFVIATGKSGTGTNRSLILSSGALSGDGTNDAQLVLDPTGNVGVGTANPDYAFKVKNKLAIDGTAATGGILLYDSASIPNFQIKTVGSITSNPRALGITNYSGPDGGYTGDIEMRTGLGGSLLFGTNGANERMRIVSSGNVGIGLTAPSYTLDVNGITTSRRGFLSGLMAGNSTFANYWYPIATATLSYQFESSSAIIDLGTSGTGSANGTASAASVFFRVKQQAALGTALVNQPLVELYPIIDQNFGISSNLAAIVTTMNGSQVVVNLYARVVSANYETLVVTARSVSGNFLVNHGAVTIGASLPSPAANAPNVVYPAQGIFVARNGNVGVGTTSASARLSVAGAVVSSPSNIASGATVDLSASNTITLGAVGGSTITLQNMVHGGTYTLVIQDTTSRTYTFSGCNTSKFKPANTATSAGTGSIYTILTVFNGTNYDCWITWASGYQ